MSTLTIIIGVAAQFLIWRIFFLLGFYRGRVHALLGKPTPDGPVWKEIIGLK